MRSQCRLLIGLVLAVALAWGASPGLRATAKAAADATAKAAVTTATPATPAPAAVAAKPDAAAKAPLPSKPLAGTTAAAAAAKAQKQPKNIVTDRIQTNKAIKAAAKAARARGLKPGVAGLAGTAAAAGPSIASVPPYADPGGIPHYFGPYGNWAFSPLPTGTLNTALTVDAGGTGYSATPAITITDAYDATKLDSATATVVGGVITAIALTTPGTGYSAPVVTIADASGTGAAASATLNVATVTGGLTKFVDKLPGLGPTGANGVLQAHGDGQYIPVGVAEPCTYSSQDADCYSIGLVEYSEKLSSQLAPTKLRGYVQLETPGLLAFMAAQTPPLVSKHVPVNGGKFAIDNPHYLGPVLVAKGRVLGIANTLPNDPGSPKPVRITFYNLLPPTSAGGDLFLPVDDTVAGAGVGPSTPVSTAGEKYPQNRATIHLHGNNTVWISDGNTHQWITPASETTSYPAGVSARNVPDMADMGCDAVAGTGLPGDPANRKSSGCQTFFYSNAQSARLQFYHDHAMGITRLNVYAGEAAGYVITDAVEQDMINGTNFTGVNINCVDGTDAGTVAGDSPGECARVLPGLGIPLVIQDKTFVEAAKVFAQDPTWNWGTGARDPLTGKITAAVDGDLWYPHVYMVVSNPYDPMGVNPFGKWFYGPWFNPPTPVCVNGGPVGCIDVGLVPNEYAGTAPWEAPLRPGVPNPSIPGESFMDTPLVNGTVYPYVEVPAGPVRFRILNANNDRGLNLQLYTAADKTADTTPKALTPAPLCTGAVATANCTEVRMVPVSVAPANQFADTPSGIADPTTAAPPWIQIGTEGGFMPAPVVVPQQPIGYNMNTGQFNFSIVNQHSLYLQPAERADVIADFTGMGGQTLILYNDSPAPIPAGAAVYDFYTGDGDQTGSGGAPNTLPGYGPNTRTIMQIRVTGAAGGAPDTTLANLRAVWAKNTAAGKRGVFEVSQDQIVIPQAAYGSAYDNTTFPTDSSQYILNVGAFDKTFQPLGYDSVAKTWSLQTAVTIPLELKAMHDEMGGVYDTGFGRMSGMLGITNPTFPGMIPFPYSSPPTDVVKGSLEATPIGQLADGTQLWRIFHNGVDTHPIHTHLFTAQLINRVGQDSQVADGTLPVDPTDLGWKDTFKINPLEVIFLALRPTVPTVSQVPFEVPNSVRLLDPTLPEGATLPPPGPAGWFDPATNTIPEILNHYVNFGWEYVWHCHILSHEEMDLMHSLVFAAPPRAPSLLSASFPATGATRVVLTWTDNSTQEAQFTIQRATNATFTSGLTTFTYVNPATTAPSPVTYTDSTVAKNTSYWYRVVANGQVAGDVATANFPTMSADSSATTSLGANFVTITTGTPPTTIAAPGVPTAIPQAGPQVSLTWRDNATNETGFIVNRCTVVPPATTCSNFAQIAAPGPRNNTGNVTYVDTTVAFGNSYLYQVAAFNAAGPSAFATMLNPVAVAAIPPAPTNFTVSAVKANGNNYTASLGWAFTTVPASNPASFTIERANNLDFTTGLTTFTAAGTARTLTQTVTRNTVYYYRIRANNSLGGSSAKTNALPFPIRTGN
jgi:FtsP/CotA-like multicopper oxidase with cupredoxin domain